MLSLIDKIIPGTVDTLLRRYSILEELSHSQLPVGRRILSEKLKVSERILRKDIDVLKEAKLLITSQAGTAITPAGLQAHYDLKDIMGEYLASHLQETKLAQALGINQTIIVKGDVVHDPFTMKELGVETVNLIDRILPERGTFTIAVMGGSTMGRVSQLMDESLGKNRNLIFVPARGGLGESVAYQANTIASDMAKSTNGQSHMLHAPESVSSETRSLLLQEPEIKETLAILDQANIVLFSIGDAMEMAKRRGMPDSVIANLKESGAVAEAFGEFVDSYGNILYKLSRVGLQSNDLNHFENIIAVAGGAQKSQAIQAYVKLLPPHTWLVTDEAAANKILNGL